jgi:glycosyltransferase involved in cell wall biosynthesis
VPDTAEGTSPLERHRLRIWLFNPYGPLPDEGWREYSYVTIGSALAAAGHEVVWWTSNFSHHFKTFRSDGWEDRALPSGLTIRLVPTPGYRRNIGLGRLARDLLFGLRAYRRAAKLERPDLVLTSEPATMVGFAGVRLAAKTRAALLYDQMDLWPELIVQALPKRLQPVGNRLFWPVYRYRRSMFRKLDGAMALARPYLDSVVENLPTDRSIPTLVVYNGIDVPAFRALMQRPLPADVAAPLDRPGLKAIFAGSLGPSYDIDAMIDTARALARSNRRITIYVAGDGPGRPRLQEAAGDCPSLVYLGKISPEILPGVYARCDIGLACYSENSNVEMCDKFYDYSAAGLAIVNSLGGEVREWIERADLGLQYRAGNADSLTETLMQMAADERRMGVWRANSGEIAATFDKTAQHARLSNWVESVVSGRST